MIRKIIKGIIVSAAIAVLPVLGNIRMFYYPQIWIFFAVGFFASILQPDYRIVDDNSKIRDKGTETQIIWSVFITQLFIVLEAAYLRFPASVTWNIFTGASLFVMILGLTIRTWAIYTLGNYFTMHLSIQKEHKIIRQGPYKYVRHPSYVGAFFTFLGTAVFMHAWFSLILAAIVLPVAWLRRIHYEEKLLLDELGEEYKSYCKSVKRAIPYIW
jgi:protein-S-isoprenylcysteine O-methyltransferase